MPVATAVLAIAGAFATTSMQSSSSSSAYQLKTGYVLQADGQCNITASCSTIPGPICRSSYPIGDAAYEKPFFSCTKILYRI